MKVLDITILNTTAGGDEPIPVTAATDLSSFGYFQRQVRIGPFSLLRLASSTFVLYHNIESVVFPTSQ